MYRARKLWLAIYWCEHLCVCGYVRLMHIHAGRRSGERRSGYTMSPNVWGSNTTLFAGPHRFFSPLCLFAFCGVCVPYVWLGLWDWNYSRVNANHLLFWPGGWGCSFREKTFDSTQEKVLLKNFWFQKHSSLKGRNGFLSQLWESIISSSHPPTPPTATFNSVTLYTFIIYKEKQVRHYTGVLGRLIDFDRTDAILIRFFHPR
jgi:hypothetical protein